jgi:hypothetical protein
MMGTESITTVTAGAGTGATQPELVDGWWMETKTGYEESS